MLKRGEGKVGKKKLYINITASPGLRTGVAVVQMEERGYDVFLGIIARHKKMRSNHWVKGKKKWKERF